MFVIMTLNYVLYPILVQNSEKILSEGLYLFTLHQQTATRNITIWRYSRHITSTERALNDGALSRLFLLKHIKLRCVINICITTAVLFITLI